jgi:hypothetical protein
MDFKDQYPDFATIEDHIRRARAERAVAIATWLSSAVLAVSGGIKRLVETTATGFVLERDRRAIEADAFLKRSVPKY